MGLRPTKSYSTLPGLDNLNHRRSTIHIHGHARYAGRFGAGEKHHGSNNFRRLRQTPDRGCFFDMGDALG